MADNNLNKQLEYIADFLVTYYSPFQMIEHKYRTKVTAIGLLKGAGLAEPAYLESYYQRLKSYKGLIKDHTDNFKLASEITIDIFSGIIKNLFINFLREGNKRDCRLLNQLIILMYPKYAGNDAVAFKKARSSFVVKYKTNRAIQYVAEFILKTYLNAPGKYDILADMIVKMCLMGISQEEVGQKMSASVYNFFVYGIYSKIEATNIYNISLKTKDGVQPMKYFTKASVLSRTVINMVQDKLSTVNFFGNVFETFEEIKALFAKHKNITVMFY